MDSPEPVPPFNGRGFNLKLLAHWHPRPLPPGSGWAPGLPARVPPRLGP